MIRKKLTRLTVVAMSAVLVVGFSACGKKKADADNKETEHVTVSAESQSIADKELTKTGIVTLEYEDGDGNIVRLEGKAVAGEDGNATIEVEDKNGNKVTFQGKASTDSNGKLQVSDIIVKEAGTLVKDDGTEINVTSDAKIEKAEESTGEGTSDIAVSEDVRKEVETANQEEKEITDAREEISNTENDVSNNDVPSENQSSNTSDVNNSDNTENNISSDNGNGSSDNNTDNNIGNADGSDNPTPTPEPEPEPVVKTMVNPIDGKIYTYIEPDEMLAKYVKNDTEVDDLNRDVNFGGGTLPYAIKEMTTRPFFYKDGTYSIFYGYYSKSGDITATPLQMGYDASICFEAIPVGRYDNGINEREYAFHYLKKYIDI